MRRIEWGLLGLVAASCVGELAPRTCAEDGDCLQGGVEGSCLASPTGNSHWCTFLSGRCPSGREWGILAGDGLEETCVAVGPGPDAPFASIDAPLGFVDAPASDAGAPPIDGPQPDADVTAPTTTITSKPSAISGTDVTFGFEANEPATFECALDGSAFTGCASPATYHGLGALPDPHRFQVRARDPSGNLEDPPAEYDWQVDPNALDTSLTSTPASTSGPSVTFSFTATRAGTFECKLDPVDASFAACTSPKSYTTLTDDRNPYTFNVRALDAAMNVDESPATFHWSVDSTGPTPTISAPMGTVGPQPTLVFQSEPGASYLCHVDALADSTCSSGMKLSTQSAGSHVVYVKGTDSFGNAGAQLNQAFTIDNTGPTFTSLTLPPDDGTTDTTFSVAYTLSDGSVTSCTLDGTSVGSCLSPLALSNLSIARHTLHLVATDAVGNTTTVDRSWVVPPVADMQDAEIVLGQAGDFTTNDANHGGVSGSSFATPLGITASSNGFLVGDQENCRVLFWVATPAVDLSARWVIGQTSLMGNTCPQTFPTAELIDGSGLFMFALPDRVLVSDLNHSRVIFFNLPIANNLPDATRVLGQANFTDRGGGPAANQMEGQAGVWSDGTRIVVADSGNNRLLFWNSMPTQDGQAADYELGWPTFDQTSTTAISPPTEQSLNDPFGVFSDGTHLVVADQRNNRVLLWNQFPSAGKAPDVVLGQDDFTTASAGSNRRSLNTPYAATINGNSLFVADRNNRRILVWTPLPTMNAEAPHAVLGASSVDALPPATGARNAFFGPRDMTVSGGRIYVTDGNRVLAFTLRN